MRVFHKLRFPVLYLAIGLAVFGVAYTLMGQEGSGGTTPAEPERTLFDVLAGGDVEELQQLLDDGADPNAKIDDVTPLSWAILGSGRTPTVYAQVKALIAAGADPNIADDLGRTALHYAAEFDGSNAVTHALIDGGAVVTAQAQNGITALRLALMSGNDGAKSAIEQATPVRPTQYEQLKAIGAFSKKLKAAKTERGRKALVRRESLMMRKRGWMTKEEREALLRAIETSGKSVSD